VTGWIVRNDEVGVLSMVLVWEWLDCFTAFAMTGGAFSMVSAWEWLDCRACGSQ
jgi:hypothetical protein